MDNSNTEGTSNVEMDRSKTPRQGPFLKNQTKNLLEQAINSHGSLAKTLQYNQSESAFKTP